MRPNSAKDIGLVSAAAGPRSAGACAAESGPPERLPSMMGPGSWCGCAQQPDSARSLRVRKCFLNSTVLHTLGDCSRTIGRAHDPGTGAGRTGEGKLMKRRSVLAGLGATDAAG